MGYSASAFNSLLVFAPCVRSSSAISVRPLRVARSNGVSSPLFPPLSLMKFKSAPFVINNSIVSLLAFPPAAEYKALKILGCSVFKIAPSEIKSLAISMWSFQIA